MSILSIILAVIDSLLFCVFILVGSIAIVRTRSVWLTKRGLYLFLGTLATIILQMVVYQIIASAAVEVNLIRIGTILATVIAFLLLTLHYRDCL